VQYHFVIFRLLFYFLKEKADAGCWVLKSLDYRYNMLDIKSSNIKMLYGYFAKSDLINRLIYWGAFPFSRPIT